MTTQTAGIVRFHVGDTELAVAAAAVEQVGPSEPTNIHLADLFGWSRRDRATHSMLIIDGDQQAVCNVDGPVRIDPVEAGGLLPVPAWLGRRACVLGFLPLADGLVPVIASRDLVRGINTLVRS